MDSRRKKHNQWSGSLFYHIYQCSWTSDVGTALSEEKQFEESHQDSSVVQVSDSIKYNNQKKKTFVSMLISGASFIYMF